MSKKCSFSSDEYDDFFDEIKPIRDKLEKEFYDNIIHYLDMNLTPSGCYHKKRKHDKILNNYKTIVDGMKSPIYKLLLKFQHNIYDAIGEKIASKVVFSRDDVIPYRGGCNSYFYPGDIVEFNESVKSYDVDKIPFRYKRRADNLPLRQREITTDEKYLILEFLCDEYKPDICKYILLQDEKGYLTAVDYPDDCTNCEMYIVDSVLSDEEYDETRYSREEAYNDQETLNEEANEYLIEYNVRAAEERAKIKADIAEYRAELRAQAASRKTSRNSKR